MASKVPPPITPKRLLVVPKRAALLAPKSSAPVIVPKATLISNKAPLIVPKAAPQPVILPTPSAAPVADNKSSSSRRESITEANSVRVDRVQSSRVNPPSLKPLTGPVPPTESHTVDSDPLDNSMDMDISIPESSLESAPSEAPVYKSMPSHDNRGINNHQAHFSRRSSDKFDQSVCSSAYKSSYTKSEMDMRQNIPGSGKVHHGGDDSSCPNAVGETPWLQIERRINEIRSLASANMHQISARSIRANDQGATSMYGNYNTHYEPRSEWKKERSHPMSYGMVHNMRTSKPVPNGRDRWDFVDGFLKPRRKPFASMSELSRHFRQIKPHDQGELIKLLLACRDLEKVIEEQHAVLDMLDHDLREAREIMKLPDHLRDISAKKLVGRAPQKEPFYPTSDIPLFIKGRVSLMPGCNDVRLSVVNN